MTFHLTEIDGEPRVRDTDLAAGLGLTMPTNIRATVAANRAELESHGPILNAPRVNGARGRPGSAYLLNEGQALVICALSRTPAAARIRHQLITVFMDWRHGKTVAVRAHNRRPPTPKPSTKGYDRYADWHAAAIPGDPRDVRLRPDPSRIWDAYESRMAELESGDDDHLFSLIARAIARLDDIAPEPVSYAPHYRDR